MPINLPTFIMVSGTCKCSWTFVYRHYTWHDRPHSYHLDCMTTPMCYQLSHADMTSICLQIFRAPQVAVCLGRSSVYCGSIPSWLCGSCEPCSCDGTRSILARDYSEVGVRAFGPTENVLACAWGHNTHLEHVLEAGSVTHRYKRNETPLFLHPFE